MTPYGSGFSLPAGTSNATTGLPQVPRTSSVAANGDVANASQTTGATPLGGDTPDQALQAGREYVQWGGKALHQFDADIARRTADISARKASGQDFGDDFDAAKRKLSQREELRDMLSGHLQRMQRILSSSGTGAGEDAVTAAATARAAERHAVEVAAAERAANDRRAQDAKGSGSVAPTTATATTAPVPDPTLVAATYRA